MSYKFTLALGGGALGVCWNALANFPRKLRLKFFFSALGGCTCTHCTPGYAYEMDSL